MIPADIADRIVGTMCRAQVDFIIDSSRWSIACNSKQSGKNYSVTRLMFLVALDRPKANVIYVNATYNEAWGVMWNDGVDGLKAVAHALGVRCVANESRMMLTLSNGSTIRLMGADKGAWEKILGQKIDLLVADEMQKMDDEGLTKAIRQVLPDRFAARHGMFRGIGTPNEFCVGVLHEISTHARDPETGLKIWPEFTVHHWTAQDLKDITPVWYDNLRWKESVGMSDDDPIWLRDKLGLWVPQDSSLVLPLGTDPFWAGPALDGGVGYPAMIPSLTGTPVKRSEQPIVTAGLDFGFTDSAAVFVGSVSREEGVGRELHSWKEPGLNTRQLAAKLRELKDRFGIRTFYADDAAAQTIEDLRTDYHLPVVPADKMKTGESGGQNKEYWIMKMRAAYRDGQLKLIESGPLHVELRTLAPDPDEWRKKRITPRAGQEDHCYDAHRYWFRGTWSEHVRQPAPPMTEMERELAMTERHRKTVQRPSSVSANDMALRERLSGRSNRPGAGR